MRHVGLDIGVANVCMRMGKHVHKHFAHRFERDAPGIRVPCSFNSYIRNMLAFHRGSKHLADPVARQDYRSARFDTVNANDRVHTLYGVRNRQSYRLKELPVPFDQASNCDRSGRRFFFFLSA